MHEDVLYRIEVRDMPEQELAVIVERVRAAELDGWLGAALRELLGTAGEQGSGPPFAIAPAPDAEGMVEARAALPVVGEVQARGRVELRHDHGFRALVALHRGPYETLETVRRVLRTAIEEEGIEPAGEPRVVYLGDPAEVGDPSHLLTEVVWPVAVDAGWRPRDALFTRPLSRS